MADFWLEWGSLAYVVAVVWSFFEGETFVLLAAAAGRTTGLIDPWILMFCVWGGSFLGDQLWFTLGKRYGRAAVRRIPGATPKLEAALRFLDRYGTAFVLTFRFIYGIRNVAAAACGVAGMDRLRFAVLNFAAAGVWAASFLAAGWYAVSWLGERNTFYVFGAVGFSAVVFFTTRAILAYRRRATVVRKIAPTPAPSRSS